jgi:hypothetical protein
MSSPPGGSGRFDIDGKTREESQKEKKKREKNNFFSLMIFKGTNET